MTDFKARAWDALKPHQHVLLASPEHGTRAIARSLIGDLRARYARQEPGELRDRIMDWLIWFEERLAHQ